MRVFICSTCYDLIDLRSELESFFLEAGALPVMSDRINSDFKVLPDRNSIETCLANVRDCDEFVIVLSNRYGPPLGAAGFEDLSAIHLEYREARKSNKPIRMFVRDRLEGEYGLWQKGRKSPDSLELSWCKDRDNWKIFELLEEHRKLANAGGHNNWFWIFQNSVELKQRLASEFKDTFARVGVKRLFENRRIPFIEIAGKVTGQGPGSQISFELTVRNLGDVPALTPKLEFKNDTEKWEAPSLGGKEHVSRRFSWAHNGAALNLPVTFSYSILEGHRLADDGLISITYNHMKPGDSKVAYELKERRYVSPALEIVVR